MLHIRGRKISFRYLFSYKKSVNEIAELLEISDLLQRRPNSLSGGQQQRVAIARALVREPSLFLMDEPLSNLDSGLRVQMRSEIKKLHKKLKATVIYVTHDQVEALSLATKIIIINQGRIEQIGSPYEIFKTPKNEFVAKFFGTSFINIFDSCDCVNDGKILLISFFNKQLVFDRYISYFGADYVDIGNVVYDYCFSFRRLLK